jgi:hypothetical protein
MVRNDYDKWHHGYNTDNLWPLKLAHKIVYKQCDLIGDARINWELNRHLDFPYLAIGFYLTKDKKTFKLLKDDFYNWCEQNPFLIGISWTSVMEVAIRAFSWLCTYDVLKRSDEKDTIKKICDDLKIGILNQVIYVTKHYSRYSSANNHLIVEMFIIGICGLYFSNDQWLKLSLDVLEYEFDRQTFEDGVNKEQSIHYHTFVMEAMSLLIIMLRNNRIRYPKVFDVKLEKMCEFVADLIDQNNNIADIGDSDEGKLLNLTGQEYNHYLYVLQIGSILFNKNYTDMENINQNLYYLFGENDLNKVRQKYDNYRSKSYIQGGYTILKFKDDTRERIMTFDHAPLGFGAIAAHGHADALSITLSIDGEKFLIDPGTYIYHMELKWRNYFRKTINHNTVTINNCDQSEMKGAFLWGKRAECKRIEYITGDYFNEVIAEHNGYYPIIHKRKIKYFKPDLFVIIDEIDGCNFNYALTYMIDSKIILNEAEGQLILESNVNKIFLYNSEEIYNIKDEWQSRYYGSKENNKAIRVVGNNRDSKTLITILSINNPIDIKKDGVITNLSINNKYKFTINGGKLHES